MKHLFTNVRIAAGTAREHLTDDPALLMLQASRWLPSSVVQPIAQLINRSSNVHSSAIPALFAGLIVGDQQDVVRRLEEALARGMASADKARSMADVALVANRPDLADGFLAHAQGSRRFRAVQARRFWYSGALTRAVGILEDAEGRAERRQRRRLAADLRILEGWRPQLTPVSFEPAERRVLHVLTNSLPHTASGYAQRSHSILLAQQEVGWETLAVTRLGYPVQVGKLGARQRDVVDGVTYQRLLPPHLAGTMDGRLQQQAEAVLAVASEFRPNVLHTTTHHVNALVTRAVAEALGIPWVYEVRGQLADTWAATRGPEARYSERYRLFQKRETEAMRSCDLVVTLGQAMKDNIVSAGIPAEKILVAPNAVGGQFLSEPKSPVSARRSLGLPEDGLFIGTVSSLVGYEGLDDLVRAFAILAPEYPQLRLLIVGDGVAGPALKEQVRALGLADRVIFPGRVPRHLTPLYHQALDVFVIPRKDLGVTRAVTPLKPVEALASGRPVVGSDLPALREIIDDGGNGLLAPAASPDGLARMISVLLSDESRRASLGSSGRAGVLAERTWAANAKSLASHYTGLDQAMRRRTSVRR